MGRLAQPEQFQLSVILASLLLTSDKYTLIKYLIVAFKKIF